MGGSDDRADPVPVADCDKGLYVSYAIAVVLVSGRARTPVPIVRDGPEMSGAVSCRPAQILALKPTTLESRMKKLGIERAR